MFGYYVFYSSQSWRAFTDTYQWTPNFYLVFEWIRLYDNSYSHYNFVILIPHCSLSNLNKSHMQNVRVHCHLISVWKWQSYNTWRNVRSVGIYKFYTFVKTGQKAVVTNAIGIFLNWMVVSNYQSYSLPTELNFKTAAWLRCKLKW